MYNRIKNTLDQVCIHAPYPYMLRSLWNLPCEICLICSIGGVGPHGNQVGLVPQDKQISALAQPSMNVVQAVEILKQAIAATQGGQGWRHQCKITRPTRCLRWHNYCSNHLPPVILGAWWKLPKTKLLLV
jgi:hypothetical protein